MRRLLELILIALFLWVLVMPGTQSRAFAQEPASSATVKNAKDAPDDDKDKAAPLTPVELKMKRFSRLAVGASSTGIIRPAYRNTVIVSLTTADVITREDEENIRIDNMVITLFSELDPNKVEKVIAMKVAYHHIPSGMLSSPTPSMIEEVGKYHIVGESVVYDPEKRIASMDGSVRAVFDYKTFSGEDGKEGEKAKDKKENTETETKEKETATISGASKAESLESKENQ